MQYSVIYKLHSTAESQTSERTHNLISSAKIIYFIWKIILSSFTTTIIYKIIFTNLQIQFPKSVLSPFLTGRMFVNRTYFGHFDELWFIS